MSTIGPGQMVPFLAKLHDEIPSIAVEIKEAAGQDLADLLLDGELELALIGLPSLPDRLRAIPLYSERYTIAFPKGHRFEQMNAIPCAELGGEDYLKRVHCEFSDTSRHSEKKSPGPSISAIPASGRTGSRRCCLPVMAAASCRNSCPHCPASRRAP